jgi:hypothetical protein
VLPVRIFADLMTLRHESICAFRICGIRRGTTIPWRECRKRRQSNKAEAAYALQAATLTMSEACCSAAERVFAFEV